eukprot:348619_1
MSHHAVFVGNVIGLVFIYVLSIPIISYYTYRFYQHKSSPIMKHRDVLFVISLNGLIIFGFITQRTFLILEHVGLISFPIFLRGLLSGITVWGTIDLLCIKSYLLYFQHKYHLSMQNAPWKQSIDSSWNDWYLRNKNKWGRFSYAIRWLAIPYVLSLIISALGYPVLGWLFMYIFQGIVVFVPVLLLIIFSYRMRGFYDIYGIRKEILSQLLSFVILGAVYFIASYTAKAIYPNDHEQREHMTSVFGTFVVVISFSFVAFSSVYYPLYLVQQREGTVQQEKTDKRVHLISAIRDPTMLSLLMQHSVTEFNTENLLFIIEIVQIKHAYATARNNVIRTSNRLKWVPDEFKEDTPTVVIDFNAFNKSDTEESSTNDEIPSCITTYLLGIGCVKIAISSKLPTSDVLTKHPNDIKAQINALYHKYVENGSCFELNIPFEMRENMLSFLTKDKTEAPCVEGDWFWVMDAICLHIMTDLLDALFNRFRKTEPFLRYVESKEYKTPIKDVKLINSTDKPGVYDGTMYDQIASLYGQMYNLGGDL